MKTNVLYNDSTRYRQRSLAELGRGRDGAFVGYIHMLVYLHVNIGRDFHNYVYLHKYVY